MKYRFLILFTFINAFSFAGDLENKVLLELLTNPTKKVKDHCELGNGKTMQVKDFIAGYIQWTFRSQNLNRKFLKCEKLESSKKDYTCDFKYSETSKGNEHPGWDLDLEFKYKEGKGIDWKSLDCVATP